MISSSLSRKRRFRAEGVLRETGCSSASLTVCTHTCGNRPASQKSRRPGPLKVEATDPAITVEDLPDQIEAWHQLGFHRPETDLFEGDPTRRYFCVVPAAILHDGKSKLGQCSEDVVSILALQLGNGRVHLASDVMNDRLSESLGKTLRQCLDQ